MFQAGWRPSKQARQRRSGSLRLQNNSGFDFLTRQHDPFNGSSQLRNASIHDAVGWEIKDESGRLRSASRTFAKEKGSHVVNFPHSFFCPSRDVTLTSLATKYTGGPIS